MAVGISRRGFLKLSVAAAAWPVLPRMSFGPPGPEHLPAGPSAPAWGRLIVVAHVLDKAAPDGKVVKTHAGDDVVAITGEVHAPGLYTYNDLWYLTRDGYLYSSFVQPVENSPQPVEQALHLPVEEAQLQGGFWAEVSVPYTDSRLTPDSPWVAYRLYYGSVFRVLGLLNAPDGTPWYALGEGEVLGAAFYAPATALRRIRTADLAPLSPGADKYIKINLSTQTLEAYEGTQLVRTMRTATGAVYKIDGKIQDFSTPPGHHAVIRKDIADHMTGGTRGKSDYYDLPGVPFCTYFTGTGVAIHGAYWHNDFGSLRSHGCVNVLPADARWVFRWAEPTVPYENWLTMVERGTPIEVAG